MTIACDATKIRRGSLYCQPKLSDDEEVKQQIELAIDKRPSRGFPKIFYAIHRQGYRWNHKKVYRVYRENEFQLKIRKKQRLDTLERKTMPTSDPECFNRPSQPSNRSAHRPR